MEEQATYVCEPSEPAVATLRERPRVACPTCRGTGALGRQHELRAHGDACLVLTQTQWCPGCHGLGEVFA